MTLASEQVLFFFFNDTATTEIYTLSLHDALPIYAGVVDDLGADRRHADGAARQHPDPDRSEEHTSELQSLRHLVCRLLLRKKKKRFDGAAEIRETAATREGAQNLQTTLEARCSTT